MAYSIIGAGGPKDKNSIPLATKRGNHIPNEQRVEWSPGRLKSTVDFLSTSFPDIKLRSVTVTYNCLGMVFAARRTCVDAEYLDMILREDGYQKLSDVYALKIGDVVVYKKNGSTTHVAVVTNISCLLQQVSTEVEVVSKWGAHPEYVHAMERVSPLLGEPAEFWTERKNYG